MKFHSYILLFLFTLTINVLADTQNPHIVVVVASYKNSKFYEKNLDTVVSQKANGFTFEIVYVDDCSPDGTAALVEKYTKDNNLDDKITLVKNPIRCKAMRNFYVAIHKYCPDDVVVATYDGDDWLTDKHALQYIMDAYKNPNVWLTYGSLASTIHGPIDWCQPIDPRIIRAQAYRRSPWRTGPLRTFYAWLFKQIKMEDFLYEGAFFEMAQDQAIMHPLLELADGKIHYIPHLIYMHNEHNPISDWNVSGRLQHFLRNVVLNKKPYQPLPERPKTTTKEPAIYVVVVPQDPQQIQQLLKNLYSDANFLKHDTCLFVAEQHQKLLPQNLTPYTKHLDSTQAFIATFARYKNKENTYELKHSSYLWDNMFTSQLGWKPQLMHEYQEHAWLLPTKECIKHPEYVQKLVTEQTAHHKTAHKLRQKAGLIVIT